MKCILIVAGILAFEASAIAAPTAEGLFNEGQTAFERADYPTAIARWKGSYQLSGVGDLLYNIAQALRLSGDCTRALETYRKFLTNDADAASDQHKHAEDFVRELTATCAVKDVPIVQSPPPLPALRNADALGHPWRTASIATGSAGAVAIITGLILGHHGQTIGTEVTAACSTSCAWSTQKGSDAAGRRDVAIGYALDAVGAAAIIGGSITYYLSARAHGVAVEPRAGGGVVSWGGSW